MQLSQQTANAKPESQTNPDTFAIPSHENAIPPSQRQVRQQRPATPSGEGSATESKGVASKAAWLGGLVLLGVLFLGQLRGTEEVDAKNWHHHVDASSNSSAGVDKGIKWIDLNDEVVFAEAIPMAPSDIDPDTTQAWKDAGRDVTVAETLLRSAQPDLVGSGLEDRLETTIAQPTLTTGLDDQLLTPGTNIYYLYLFDSCYEDGDVVDVIINGHRFATVQLTNQGATLAVPMNQASVVSVRGVWDGGGGITVACRTSRGEGFVRPLAEGEEHVLARVGF